MAATIKDIQKNTGLGLATISRYLNGKNVREKNQVLIEEAIKDLNYSTNEHARNLKLKNTMTVGILVPELNNYFVMKVLATCNEILRNNGYTVIVCNGCRDVESEEREVKFLINKKIDGLITVPVSENSFSFKSVKEEGIPLLLLDSKIDSVDIHYDSVTLDNFCAAEKSTTVLIENGHRKIAILVDSMNNYTAKRRIMGYQKTLEKHGIDFNPDYIIEGGYPILSNANAITDFLSIHPEVTAVFTSNYNATLGAMSAFNENGISVPDDISLMGFGNIPFNAALNPQVSLIFQPLEEIGEYVAKTIISRMQEENKTKSPVDISLQGIYCEGKSIKNISKH